MKLPNTENKDKQIYFLCAMPRSGNTLFTSIMNQNPELVVTPNSITLEIMKDLLLLKRKDTFQNFPDEQSLNNVMDEVYNLYYKYWNYKIIIDITLSTSNAAQENQYVKLYSNYEFIVKVGIEIEINLN